MTIHWPDPRLRTKSLPVDRIDGSTRELYLRLCEAMLAEGGAGISAIQIGVPLRMFVVSGDLLGASLPICVVNPRLVRKDALFELGSEGCLSLPGVTVSVRRSSSCVLEATDLGGLPFTVAARGFAARCVLHELDHLNGRLMTDIAERRGLL